MASQVGSDVWTVRHWLTSLIGPHFGPDLASVSFAHTQPLLARFETQMRTTFHLRKRPLLTVALTFAAGCGKVSGTNVSPNITTTQANHVGTRIAGTMPSVEESLAVHGYCFYEQRLGSPFRDHLPIPPARRRLSIKPTKPSHLEMRFDLADDGITIMSVRLIGNSKEEYFLFEVDNVSRELALEFFNEKWELGRELNSAIRTASDRAYSRFDRSQIGEWIVEREKISYPNLVAVTIRRDNVKKTVE